MQFDGDSYLLPTDIDSSTEDDIRFDAAPLDKLLALVRALDNGMNIVVLDACRNNPFTNPFGLLTPVSSKSMLPLLWGAINGSRLEMNALIESSSEML